MEDVYYVIGTLMIMFLGCYLYKNAKLERAEKIKEKREIDLFRNEILERLNKL